MKVRAYLRVAKTNSKTGYRVAASVQPKINLLDNYNTVYPTVAFAVDLDIPDKMFERAEEVVATITIPEEQVTIAGEVVDHESGEVE